MSEETEIEVKLPPKPEEPLQSDCCGNGCTPCVFDRYDEELRLWGKECERVTCGDISCEDNLSDTSSGHVPALSESEYRFFPILSIKEESRDSCIIKFELPPGKSLGLTTGQHIILRMTEDNKVTTRQYTPISPVNSVGYFELLIKIYPRGRMSHYLKKLQPGDRVNFRGPCGSFTYKPNKWDTLYMLAAGTGIAPMTQVIQQVISYEEDDTRVSLIYTCKTYEDLLLRSQLNEWTAYWNVNVLYILTQDNEDRVSSIRKYGEDIHCCRVDSNVLSKIFTDRPQSYHVLICGTPSFEKDMMEYLQDNDHASQNYHKF